jgi:hypothetical protein
VSNITGTIRGRATVQEAGSVTVYNVSVTLANTEFSQDLTEGTKAFTIRVRGGSSLKLAFEAGQSGTNYVTIPPGANYTAEGLNFSGTLYFQTPKPSQTVEIVEWV